MNQGSVIVSNTSQKNTNEECNADTCVLLLSYWPIIPTYQMYKYEQMWFTGYHNMSHTMAWSLILAWRQIVTDMDNSIWLSEKYTCIPSPLCRQILLSTYIVAIFPNVWAVICALLFPIQLLKAYNCIIWISVFPHVWKCITLLVIGLL